MLELFDDFWVKLIMFVCVLIFAILIFSAIDDGKKWEKFKIDHKCEVVAHIKGDVFNTFGIDMKGSPTVGIASTPDKIGWKCDDGITYYR